MDDNLPSDGHSVYLATRFDRFYMKRVLQYHGGSPVILEVQVPREKLSADEEWLTPDEADTLDTDEALYHTMCGGSCKHFGPVSLGHVLSISAADGTVIYERK